MIETLQTAPSRNGVLKGLKTLESSDLPRWKRALQSGGESGFGCYFPYLLAHQRPGKATLLVTEDDGSLCTFIQRDRKRGSRLDVFLNPIPMNVSVTRRCLERANEFNGDRSARILRIDGKDAALAKQVPRLKVRVRRKQYVYAPRSYADLSGRKFRALRNHVDQARQLPDLEVVPYTASHAGACRELLRKWAQRYRAMFGKSGGAGISGRALAQTEALSAPDLMGEVVLLGGRVVAYALGGELRPGVACFLDAKCDLDVPGLGYFQRYHFITKLNGFEQVNDGSDARRPGLRQLKNSFRPIEMHPEYRGRQDSR